MLSRRESRMLRWLRKLEIHLLMFTNMQYFLWKIQGVATPIPPSPSSANVWLFISQTHIASNLIFKILLQKVNVSLSMPYILFMFSLAFL